MTDEDCRACRIIRGGRILKGVGLVLVGAYLGARSSWLLVGAFVFLVWGAAAINRGMDIYPGREVVE